MKNKIILNHLYSKSLNIYGDLGNIIALKYLCGQLGVGLEVINTEIGDELQKADMYFIGGGQDKDQLVVYEDLLRHKEELAEEVERGKVFLLICGGFQLFGDYFVDGSGNKIAGLGILPMETKAPDYNVASRSIGNLVVRMSEEFVGHWGIDRNFSEYLVGFENHGGQTTLNKFNEENKASNQNKTLRTIGEVVVGKGNNATDKVEGVWTKNIVGCYLHGSLLPKNPHLGISIIKKSLGIKNLSLKDLDLDLEKKAHWEMLGKLGVSG